MVPSSRAAAHQRLEAESSAPGSISPTLAPESTTRRPALRKIRVAVLGLGRMGRLHARIFSECTDRFEWVGAYDPRIELEGPPSKRFASAEALLKAAELVVIAVPTALHAQKALLAMNAGCTVLVEKPLAATGAEAQRLAAVAETLGARLFVGHSERFNPVVRAIRDRIVGERIERIAIDRIVPIPVLGVGGAPMSGASSGGPGLRIDTEDALLNLGVHDMDLVEYLTGADAVVLGASGSHDTSHVRLLAGSALARLRCGRQGERVRRIHVETETLELDGDLLSPQVVAIHRTTGERERLALHREEPLRAQAEALHAAMIARRHDSLPLAVASGAQGARAVALAERAIALRDSESRSKPRVASGS